MIYLKDYNYSKPFKPAYSYTPIISVVNDYRIKGKSWKYTSALIEQGTKDYIGSTVDGDGNDIKIYKRYNYSIKSINAIIQEYKISEEDAYKRFSKYLFQTEMPQSSIRFRVMNKVKEIGQDSDLYSIEYIPKQDVIRERFTNNFIKVSPLDF